MRILIFVAFAFSGAAALIYEVAWTRSISLVLGSTTYALSTMLSSFMAGLALGGYLGGKLADRSKNLVLNFGLIELGIGIFGLLTLPLIHGLSPYYIALYKALHLSPAQYMFVQFLICFSIMAIPTVLMGITFPLVSKIVTDSTETLGRGVGNAYSSNTFGAIIGSLGAGFLLIPFFGVRYAVLTAAMLNIIVALSMIVSSRVLSKERIALLLVFITLTFSVIFVSDSETEWIINYHEAIRYTDTNKYNIMDQPDWQKAKSEMILFKKDFPEGRVRLSRAPSGVLILEVGGKVEGTSLKDLPNTRALAYLPIASHPKPETFLTIGLGAGVTFGAAREHIKDVSLVEINPGVVEAIGMFGPSGLLDGVDITINDARNFLTLTESKFDIISSEPSYPTELGTGNLFTKEFYVLARNRLNEGGIYCQWLPYYVLSNDDITMMLKTFNSAFDNVFLWKVPETLDLIMVGSSTPFVFGADDILARVKALNIHPEPIDIVLSRIPEQVRQIVLDSESIPMNTDDRPVLEFHAAINFLTGVQD